MLHLYPAFFSPDFDGEFQTQPHTICPALTLSECSIAPENSKKCRPTTKAKKRQLRLFETQLKVFND